MIGIFQKLKTPATNPDLPTIGAVDFEYDKMEVEFVTTLKIAVREAVTASAPVQFIALDGAGEFMTAQSGGTSLGSSVTFNTGGDKTLYYKATKSGKIRVNNAVELERLGSAGDWSPTNQFQDAPTGIRFRNFNIEQLALCIHLKAVKLGAIYSFGNVSVFANMPSLVSLHIQDLGSAPMTGSSAVLRNLPLVYINWQVRVPLDLADIPNTARAMQSTSTVTPSVRYTGNGSQPSFSLPLLANFDLRGVGATPTAEIDLFIKALTSLPTPTTNRIIYLKGARSSASDVDVAALAAKNYTVTVTA